MRIRKSLRREDGAAAVEFALIVGVLAMLIFGMLQFGLAFFELQNLRAATREASRVGSVDGQVSDIQTRMQQLTGIAPTSWGSSLHIEAITGGSISQVTGATTRPCNPATGTPPDSVRTRVDLSDPTLPPSLQNIFTVDIPLMPPISLRSAQVYGDFRCES
jgi:Flp pilus assembly protein TadG